MPKDATARIEDVELRMNEPPSAEEMAQREELAEMILALMDRPTTEEEREFWREFQKDLQRDRPKFR